MSLCTRSLQLMSLSVCTSRMAHATGCSMKEVSGADAHLPAFAEPGPRLSRKTSSVPTGWPDWHLPTEGDWPFSRSQTVTSRGENVKGYTSFFKTLPARWFRVPSGHRGFLALNELRRKALLRAPCGRTPKTQPQRRSRGPG